MPHLFRCKLLLPSMSLPVCPGFATLYAYAQQLTAKSELMFLCTMQVLADAQAVDDLRASGHDTRPLCGLAFAVKDNIDVVGYPTVAGTPALQGDTLP